MYQIEMEVEKSKSLLSPRNQQLLEESRISNIKAVQILGFFSDLIGAVALNLFAPYLPLEMEKQGYDTSYVGIILSGNAIGNIVLTPFIPYIFATFTTRSILTFWGFGTIIVLAVISISLENQMNEPAFIFLSTFLRAFHGGIQNLRCSTNANIIFNYFPLREQCFSISILIFAYSFGILLGHFIGGIFYEHFGAYGPPVFVGILIITLLPMTYIILPPLVDEKTETEKDGATMSSFKVLYEICCRIETFFLVLFIFFGALSLYYLEPILALRLEHHYQLSLFWNNMVFLAQGIGFLLGTLIFMVQLRRSEVNGVKILIFSTFFSGVAILISGPAIFLPDSLFLVFLGNFLLGVFIAPSISIIIQLLKQKTEEVFKEESIKFRSMITPLNNLVYQIGATFGRTFSQFFSIQFGYRENSTLIGMSNIVLVVLYLLFGGVMKEFKS